MSEKDIIDKFTEIVEDAREESWYEYYDALRNTLDLIKKLQQELQQEKEKNKENIEALEEWINGERISVKYISKDKIKEKIKGREHIIHNAKLKYGKDYEIYDDVIYARDEIELLKELLEE